MLLHCCFTPAHEVLYREVFLPSVPEGFEVCAAKVGIEGRGDYLSEEFLRCIRAKMDLVVESVARNSGSTIVWSDVDVRILALKPSDLGALLSETGCTILFQRESPRTNEVNTGFFVCQCTEDALGFFQTVRDELDRHPGDNEQMVVNRLLLENPGIAWGYLPRSFYARTHGWPPPARPSIYHANFTKGSDAIGQKLAQFREVDWLVRGGWFARMVSIIRRIPARLGRLASPR